MDFLVSIIHRRLLENIAFLMEPITLLNEIQLVPLSVIDSIKNAMFTVQLT